MVPKACMPIMLTRDPPPLAATDCGFKQMNCVESDKGKVILFIVAMLQQQNYQHSELL